MSKEEQAKCCGLGCDSDKVREYIDRLEARTVDAMFDHFSAMAAKTRCKMLSIDSIKAWRDSLDEE